MLTCSGPLGSNPVVAELAFTDPNGVASTTKSVASSTLEIVCLFKTMHIGQFGTTVSSPLSSKTLGIQ